MKKRTGFTLVELLAVIVILALLIVITANTVLPMMKKTKKSAMVVYASNVLDKASAAYMADSLSNGGGLKKYSIEALMGQNDYYGVVGVELKNGKYEYSIAMFDAKEEIGLKISEVTSTSIEGDVNNLVKNAYYDPERNKPENYDTHAKCEDYEFSLNINLIDFTTLTVNNYVCGTNTRVGQLQSISEPWRATDFISVEAAKTYKFTVNKTTTTTVAGWAFYDAEKQGISGGSYTQDVLNSISANGFFLITAPSNAKYLRVSWRVDQGNSDYVNTVSLVKY